MRRQRLGAAAATNFTSFSLFFFLEEICTRVRGGSATGTGLSCQAQPFFPSTSQGLLSCFPPQTQTRWRGQWERSISHVLSLNSQLSTVIYTPKAVALCLTEPRFGRHTVSRPKLWRSMHYMLKKKGAVLLVIFARCKTQRLPHWPRANNSPPHICMYRAKNEDSILMVDRKEDSPWSAQIPGLWWCPGTRGSE